MGQHRHVDCRPQRSDDARQSFRDYSSRPRSHAGRDCRPDSVSMYAIRGLHHGRDFQCERRRSARGVGGVMRLRWFFIFVAGIFVSALVCAQPPSIDLSDALYFENGTIANGIYSNECLGFSLPIPAGWNINTQAGHDDKAMPHQRGLRLFVVDRPGPNASVIGIRIEMEAYDAVVEKATP